MKHDKGTSTDARTAPVAAFQIVGKMNKEELANWRIAPLDSNASAQERGIDKIPFPFGWYVACYSSEIAVGEVKPLRYFGQELAIWRGEDGQARIMDAYCRHLGAHMGHGGKVDGNQLECPFHGWHYGDDGAVVDIPYSKSIPPQVKRPCGTWPVAEENGFVWLWYHPSREEPKWEVERFSEANDPDWTSYDCYDWIVHAPLQFLAENSADDAHFQFVHGTAGPPEGNKIGFVGHRRTGEVHAKLGTPRGEVDGIISNGNIGPGQGWTRFTGISETLLLSGTTPIDHDCLRVRFAFTQPNAQTEGPLAGLARALIKDVVKQFDQDKVIWDRQRFIEQPPICAGDGPIADFRRWYYQFYPEGIGGPGERETRQTA